ncbi:MAG: hypothetical protein JRJ86_14595 [Deltaproteobacteria bacterium]|nr:hypothetical protein [Deltaproteobacteria bacterium]MBW2050152.1 hypothetical protein [Deltaproteobacteria bacterium]MBW2112576.1 hypothetical protein [Deltaproteobacteria bacterium]MBW2354793.1 hypothetical protein [Deltaproteobacteria bacterium]
MKQFKRDLQAVLKGLKQATERAEKLMEKVESLEKTKDVKKPSGPASSRAKAPKKVTDGDAVLAIIRRHRKGINSAVLREKTGFEGRKIRDIVYRLKKGGKIKVVGKGTYMKA